MDTVIKIVGEIYYIKTVNGIVCASIRNNVKKSRVTVGDYVEIVKNEFDKDKYIITNVFDRKNSIPRPVLSNIDKLLIVISCVPKPDLYLVDKLYIYSQLNNIEPVLIINKIDIADDEFINEIKKEYYFIKVFEVSAKNNIGLDNLIEYMKNFLCAVCGQSAVGKSSLINSIIPGINLSTQGLSSKIDRGKHTTRVNEIFTFDDLMIADTPGFSSLDLNLEHDVLMEYYPEFAQYLGECKYMDCSHIKEGNDCAIIEAVKRGDINSSRYDRYVYLYEKLKEKWERKYD